MTKDRAPPSRPGIGPRPVQIPGARRRRAGPSAQLFGCNAPHCGSSLARWERSRGGFSGERNAGRAILSNTSRQNDDDDRARFYYGLVYNSLHEAARRAYPGPGGSGASGALAGEGCSYRFSYCGPRRAELRTLGQTAVVPRLDLIFENGNYKRGVGHESASPSSTRSSHPARHCFDTHLGAQPDQSRGGRLLHHQLRALDGIRLLLRQHQAVPIPAVLRHQWLLLLSIPLHHRRLPDLTAADFRTAHI